MNNVWNYANTAIMPMPNAGTVIAFDVNSFNAQTTNGNFILHFRFIQNYPFNILYDPIKKTISFFMFDSYNQVVRYFTADMTNSANNPTRDNVVNTYINNLINLNLHWGGLAQSFSNGIVANYFYDPSNYDLYVIAWNLTAYIISGNKIRYSQQIFSTNLNAHFVIRAGNSGFYITAGANANTLYIYGNVQTSPPAITITSTQTAGGGGGIYPSQPPQYQVSTPNTLDIVNLALGIIVFLFPIGLIYEYTKNSRIAIVGGLVLGVIFGSLLNMIPIWIIVLVAIGLGIFLFMQWGRGG
jgi:hypothetical protein